MAITKEELKQIHAANARIKDKLPLFYTHIKHRHNEVLCAAKTFKHVRALSEKIREYNKKGKDLQEKLGRNRVSIAQIDEGIKANPADMNSLMQKKRELEKEHGSDASKLRRYEGAISKLMASLKVYVNTYTLRAQGARDFRNRINMDLSMAFSKVEDVQEAIDAIHKITWQAQVFEKDHVVTKLKKAFKRQHSPIYKYKHALKDEKKDVVGLKSAVVAIKHEITNVENAMHKVEFLMQTILQYDARLKDSNGIDYEKIKAKKLRLEEELAAAIAVMDSVRAKFLAEVKRLFSFEEHERKDEFQLIMTLKEITYAAEHS